jgi:hypothetical protein
MTHLDPPRGTSRRELRKFGLLVGGAFLALAAIALWRHRSPLVIRGFGGLGAVLVVAGAAAPTVLGPVYRGWMRLALLMSKVTTPIFMAIIYYVVLTPTGLLMRAFGWRGLNAASKDTAWVTRPAGERASVLDRQF